MIGQVTITAGVNVAAAIYLIGAATRILGLPADTAVPGFGPLTGWYFQIFVMTVIMIPQVLINVRGIRLIARLNDFSVWWHIGGVLAIAILLAAFGRHHNPAGFLFQGLTSVSPLDAASADLGGRTAPALVIGDVKLPSPLFALVPGLAELYRGAPFVLAFVLALLQAQWTYTGYDASAHIAEETVMARLNAAWGIVLSVAVSAVVGWVMLLIFTWCIPRGDVAATANDPYPVLQIVYGNLATVWAHAIALVIGVAMWLCGLASITSMGRMWYAFARDDGMPGSRILKRIHPRFRTPAAATVVASVLAVLICLYAAAYSVVTSISTITLYLAYGIPIWLNRRNRRRGRGEFVTAELAPWNLGRWAPIVNGVAIAWIVVLTVVFVLPPNELVLWTVVGLALALVAYWYLSARRHFRGPAVAREC
jgi:amino acid transporter